MSLASFPFNGLEELGLDPYDQMESPDFATSSSQILTSAPHHVFKPEPVDDTMSFQTAPVLEPMYSTYPPLEAVDDFRYGGEYTGLLPPMSSSSSSFVGHPDSFGIAPSHPHLVSSHSPSEMISSEHSFYTQQPGMSGMMGGPQPPHIMHQQTLGGFPAELLPMTTMEPIGTLPPPPQLQMNMPPVLHTPMQIPPMPSMHMPPTPGDDEEEQPTKRTAKKVKESTKKRKQRAQADAVSPATPSATAATPPTSEPEPPLPELKKPMTEEELLEFKRQQRLMRNRASAQLSRERKKAHLKDLEKQLKELMSLNSNLTGQISALKSENNTLKKRLGLPTGASPATVAAAAAAASSATTTTNTWASAYTNGELSADESSGSTSHPTSPELQTTMGGHQSPQRYPEDEYAYSTTTPSQHASAAAVNHKRQRTSTVGGGAAPAALYLSRHPNVSRTGVLLFALMFSFGIFFHLAGVPLKASDITSLSAEEMKEIQGSVDATLRKFVGSVNAPAAAAAATVRLGRVLNAVETAAEKVVDMASLNQGAVGRLPSPYSASGQDSSNARTPPPVVKVEKPTNNKKTGRTSKVEKQDLALVKLEKSVAADERKLVHAEGVEGDADRALDLYKVPDALDGSVISSTIGGFEPLNLFKKVLIGSNFTFDANASYLFCPSAIQIQPPSPPPPAAAPVAKVSKKRDMSSRLRSRGLPALSDGASSKTAGVNEMTPSTVGTKLMLWVPTSALLTGSLASLTGSTGFYSSEPGWNGTSINATGKKQSGLTEILCQISHIRPILLPDES